MAAVNFSRFLGDSRPIKTRGGIGTTSGQLLVLGRIGAQHAHECGRELLKITYRHEEFGQVLLQNHTRSSRIIRDTWNPGRELLEHTKPKRFGITGERTNRGTGEKLRELLRPIFGDKVDEIGVGHGEIVQHLSIFHQGAEKKKARVGYGSANPANNFPPVVCAFTWTPHPNEADFVFREPLTHRLRRVGELALTLAPEPVWLHQGRLVRSELFTQ